MAYLNLNAIFTSLEFYFKMHILFLIKVLMILRDSTKHANFWLGVQFPLKNAHFILYGIKNWSGNDTKYESH